MAAQASRATCTHSKISWTSPITTTTASGTTDEQSSPQSAGPTTPTQPAIELQRWKAFHRGRLRRQLTRQAARCPPRPHTQRPLTPSRGRMPTRLESPVGLTHDRARYRQIAEARAEAARARAEICRRSRMLEDAWWERQGLRGQEDGGRLGRPFEDPSDGDGTCESCTKENSDDKSSEDAWTCGTSLDDARQGYADDEASAWSMLEEMQRGMKWERESIGVVERVVRWQSEMHMLMGVGAADSEHSTVETQSETEAGAGWTWWMRWMGCCVARKERKAKQQQQQH